MVKIYACRGAQSWWGTPLACIRHSLVTYVIANTIKLLYLLSLVGNAFCAHKSLNSTDKRVVYSYVIRGNPTKLSAKVVVLNSLN